MSEAVNRSSYSLAYRDIVWGQLGYPVPEVASGDELIALARTIDAGVYEAAQNLRSEPPFPGAHAAPAELPNKRWQLICACRLFQGNEQVATAFTTISSGRPASVYVNVAGQIIPADYTPLR